MTLTLRQAIDKTLLRVQLAGGVDVQTYAEEQLVQIIQHKFNILFDGAWWPQFYNAGETFTLDGNGRVISSLAAKIKRFMDIRYIWYGTYPDPIPRLNTRANPATVYRWCYTADNTNVLRLLPTTLTDTITISYRTKPANLSVDTDVINMDDDLIILGAAYDYLDGLGINNDEVNKLLAFFDARLETLRGGIESGEVSQGSYTSGTSNDWQELT